jgi:hypothetical protein
MGNTPTTVSVNQASALTATHHRPRGRHQVVTMTSSAFESHGVVAPEPVDPPRLCLLSVRITAASHRSGLLVGLVAMAKLFR